MSDTRSPQPHCERITEKQLAMLEQMEALGLNDPERLKVMADLVKGAAAWSYLKRWLVQAAAVAGAGGVLWAIVEIVIKRPPG